MESFPMKYFFCLFVLATLTVFASNIACSIVPDRTPTDGTQPSKHFTNSLGIEFTWLSPGSFTMGSPKDEIQRDEDEVPHVVTLSRGFYMSTCLVTQEQWEKVMCNNPSEFRGQNLPVENVSWHDCQQFINCLKKKDMKPYRLPTEAEWEYACRAGSSTPFNCGATISTDQANYNGDYCYADGKKGVYRQKTTPVGVFPANAWGLFDMHGNVWQWCQDWYGDYPEKNAVDPRGPMSGTRRVARGGAWFQVPALCRSAVHVGQEPNVRNYSIGFRLCFSLE
jgi:formylglycine-generating enzyme required for sulfatase activity